MARMDHTNCSHPRTPAGRRACRAGNTPVATPAPTTDYVKEHMNAHLASYLMKARMDRAYDAAGVAEEENVCMTCGNEAEAMSDGHYSECCNDRLTTRSEYDALPTWE